MPMIGLIKSVQPTRLIDGPGGIPIRKGGYLHATGPDGVDRLIHRTELPDDLELSEALIGCYISFEPVLKPTGARGIHASLVPTTPVRDCSVL